MKRARLAGFAPREGHGAVVTAPDYRLHDGFDAYLERSNDLTQTHPHKVTRNNAKSNITQKTHQITKHITQTTHNTKIPSHTRA